MSTVCLSSPDPVADQHSAGMANAIVPVYQSEISPATQRGRMVGSHGFAVVSGYVSLSIQYTKEDED